MGNETTTSFKTEIIRALAITIIATVPTIYLKDYLAQKLLKKEDVANQKELQLNQAYLDTMKIVIEERVKKEVALQINTQMANLDIKKGGILSGTRDEQVKLEIINQFLNELDLNKAAMNHRYDHTSIINENDRIILRKGMKKYYQQTAELIRLNSKYIEDDYLRNSLGRTAADMERFDPNQLNSSDYPHTSIPSTSELKRQTTQRINEIKSQSPQ